MAEVKSNPPGLPLEAWIWFAIKVLLILFGGIIASQGVYSYDKFDQLLTKAGQPDWLSATAEPAKKVAMAWLGGSLVALSALIGLWQERAATKAAVRIEAESLFFLNNLRRRAGPRIGDIIVADQSTRNELFTHFQDLILRATQEHWEKADARLAYYTAMLAAENYNLELQRSYPADAKFQPTATTPAPLEFRTERRKRWPWHKGEFKELRKSRMFAPVWSPLEENPRPVGLLVADSPRRRMFTGDVHKVSASFAAAWLATGHLATEGIQTPSMLGGGESG